MEFCDALMLKTLQNDRSWGSKSWNKVSHCAIIGLSVCLFTCSVLYKNIDMELRILGVLAEL